MDSYVSGALLGDGMLNGKRGWKSAFSSSRDFLTDPLCQRFLLYIRFYPIWKEKRKELETNDAIRSGCVSLRKIESGASGE